jgi:hypothetical protein
MPVLVVSMGDDAENVMPGAQAEGYTAVQKPSGHSRA